jgi:hypothetical protein
MRYIHAIQGAAIAFVIFIILSFSMPSISPAKEVENILTTSIFLFAILAGFFIARLGSRYNEIRKLIGQQDALFLSLYKTSQIHGKEFTKKMVTLIDSFYIVAYDFVVGACYKGETPFFLKMWDEVINLNKKKKKNEEAYGQLMNQLNEIEKTRNVARGIYEERLSFGHWAVLIILSGIILFSIFYLKTDALYSMVITILLSTALVLILLLIRDLQNFMLGGNSLLEESGEEVFEYIGKPRYYNNLYLKGGINKLPKNIMEYRIGYHKPGANKFNIKLIKK